MQMNIFLTQKSHDYELLDSGDGQKLERFGLYTLVRPDPEALWKPGKERSVWNRADALFVRKGKTAEWIKGKKLPKSWTIEYEGLTVEIRPTNFKHTGLFPEQAANWKWMREKILKEKREVNILNLFGYTGGASLFSAKHGAKVTHVDGSKTALSWAKHNQELSGLSEKPIRWILDDATAFLKREIKRGNRYDGIIMDPPAFGHGPKGEIWKIEEQFTELFDLCVHVLSPQPIFFIINGYASGYSPTAFRNNLLELQKKYKGSIETGELGIEESTTLRVLPAGVVARWQK
jgi:23S rRNA (cytosine1962-C5)-methyltransferase